MRRPWIAVTLFAMGCGGVRPEVEVVRVERLLDAPFMTPETHPGIGGNVQVPSLIRVPEWVENPLGKYYLYFADHKGRYIRRAAPREFSHCGEMGAALSLRDRDDCNGRSG